jgi:hypothetical protein
MPVSRDETSLDKLKIIGFTHAGCWKLGGPHLQNLAFDRAGSAVVDTRTSNVLYAFVVNGKVMYIGKTVKGLKQRMKDYNNPGPTQATNKRNHDKIVGHLKPDKTGHMNNGMTVEIFVLPDNGLMHYGGFDINLAAGLEDSLIWKLAPSWNRGRKDSDDGTQSEPAKEPPIGIIPDDLTKRELNGKPSTSVPAQRPTARQRASRAEGAMTVKTPDIATVWNRIGAHAGEDFTMVRGAQFTYVVAHSAVNLNRTNQQIAKSDFEKALARVPFKNTTDVQDLHGPSFVYAILMDERIRAGEW